MADNSLFDIFTAIKCEKQFGTSISFVRTVPQLQITHFIRISNESRQNIKANAHTSTYIKPNHIKYDFPVLSQKYIFIGSYIKNHENDFWNQTKILFKFHHKRCETMKTQLKLNVGKQKLKHGHKIDCQCRIQNAM